jgi:hypothetical protein
VLKKPEEIILTKKEVKIRITSSVEKYGEHRDYEDLCFNNKKEILEFIKKETIETEYLQEREVECDESLYSWRRIFKYENKVYYFILDV